MKKRKIIQTNGITSPYNDKAKPFLYSFSLLFSVLLGSFLTNVTCSKFIMAKMLHIHKIPHGLEHKLSQTLQSLSFTLVYVKCQQLQSLACLWNLPSLYTRVYKLRSL